GSGMASGQSSGGRGVARDSSGAMSLATASRAVSGEPRSQRPRRVRRTDVLRYSAVTTDRGGIQAEIAMAGTRTPDRSKPKPSWPSGADGTGAGAGGGGRGAEGGAGSANIAR